MISRVLRKYFIQGNLSYFRSSYSTMEVEEKMPEERESVIKEAKAEIRGKGHVFYNPVQEFNRDLSTCVLSTFASDWAKRKSLELSDKIGEKDENGITILEALSATGLRSIRYAKEVRGVKEITANDFSKEAVAAIQANIERNGMTDMIKSSFDDAIRLMSTQDKKYTAIDLDPYGCPTRFLDSSVRSVEDGGLLLITATDMAILCGNTPETCYVKYGSMSLKTRACHEQAIRILLKCIESHANRYGRYITPLLSISVDFYIRVFVTINTSQQECKHSCTKQSLMYMCTGCNATTLHPLGVLKANPTERNPNQTKFVLPTGPPVDAKCEHCGHSHHIGGPIWSAPIHDFKFVEKLIETVQSDTYSYLTTQKRIYGLLSVIQEELPDIPLYYALDKLCATLKLETIPSLQFRSALLHAGYRVSLSHACQTSIKTDAPMAVLWDILRCWAKRKPVKPDRLIEGTPLKTILSKECKKNYKFDDIHPDANPKSRKEALVRYPENPAAHWGPGTRNTLMVGDNKMLKSLRNQNKNVRKAERDKVSPDPKQKRLE